MRALLAIVLALFALPVQAQDFTALARLDPQASRIEATEDGGLALVLHLSQVVPWRIFTLDDPLRLVVDFSEVDWRGASSESFDAVEPVDDLRVGTLRPGWSRMVLVLSRPLALESAGMAQDTQDQSATLRVALTPTDPVTFAATAGAPPDPGWDALMPLDMAPPVPAPPEDGLPVIVIDPGHGGIDPGAQRDGLSEAELMLALALELAEALERSGRIHTVLTRSDDSFISLQARMTLARQVGAVALISLHADALEEDVARGASIYTLTDEARDQASQRMAERHERGDLLAGLDLSQSDDRIATALMDLARLQTAPQSERLAQALVAGLHGAGARLNSHPRREAALAVLNAADFASVLLETGFLSDARDRAILSSPEGRASLVAGITHAIVTWLDEEEHLRSLTRR